MTHLTELGDEEVVSDVVGGDVLLLLGELKEAIAAPDLHVGLRALKELLDCLEITLNIEVKMLGLARSQQLVHSVHSDEDESIPGNNIRSGNKMKIS